VNILGKEGCLLRSGFEASRDFADKLDMEDPLAGFRKRFYVPDGTIYMDGNSLGLFSKDAEHSTLRVLDEWRTLAIGGWLKAKKPWFYLAEELGTKCSRLVGAQPDEVVLTGIDRELVGTSAANIEHATHIRNRDPRVFQDGIYIVQRG
jgi:kynureninase